MSTIKMNEYIQYYTEIDNILDHCNLGINLTRTDRIIKIFNLIEKLDIMPVEYFDKFPINIKYFYYILYNYEKYIEDSEYITCFVKSSYLGIEDYLYYNDITIDLKYIDIFYIMMCYFGKYKHIKHVMKFFNNTSYINDKIIKKGLYCLLYNGFTNTANYVTKYFMSCTNLTDKIYMKHAIYNNDYITINHYSCNPNFGKCYLYAAACGNIDMMMYLENLNINTRYETKKGNSAYIYAARYKHVHVLKYLDSLNSDNKYIYGNTSFLYAAINNDIDIVKYLENHIYINFKCVKGITAYMYSSIYGHIELMKYLEFINCDIHKIDFSRKNAYLYAVEYQQLETMKYLESRGINIHHKYIFMASCILEYIDSEEEDNFDYEQPFEPMDIFDYAIENAYLMAVRIGNIEIIEHLEKVGLNINSINNIGSNAYSVAIHSGNIKVIKYIRTKKINRCLIYDNTSSFTDMLNLYNDDIMSQFTIKKNKMTALELKSIFGVSLKEKDDICMCCYESKCSRRGHYSYDLYIKCRNNHIYHLMCCENAKMFNCILCGEKLN
jgi:ankyrin repeat protein